ncbi:MAG: hypothetical protein NTU85_03510 [Candidatus Kaiserbacteria bacterium]|nr:hypothetical protein [Candidatus Kaiserbacteria bacterium]
MQFQVLSRWFSATAKTVTGTLSSAATTVTLANAGTARVTAVTITVTAVGGGPLTGVKVGRTGYTELEYTGVIQPSKALEINTGAWSVLNDGVADYTTEHFRLTANHHEVFWLRLPRLTGADVVVTRTGGSATDTAVFSYYEAWQ